MSSRLPGLRWSSAGWLLAAILMLPAPALADPAAAAAPPIVISSVPSRSVSWVARIAEPALRELSRALGREVRFAGEPTYDAWLVAAREGRYDYVIPPPHLVEEFIRARNFHAVAVSTIPLTISLIALDSLPEPGSADFPKPLRVGLPPESSTASLWAGNLLEESGFAGTNEIVEVRMQSHQDVILAVSRGTVDAGVTIQFQVDMLVPDVRERIRVMASHQGLPLSTVLAHPRIPLEEAQETGARFAQILNSLDRIDAGNPAGAVSLVATDTEHVMAMIEAAKRSEVAAPPPR